jgi:hypothetical protein
MAWDLVAEADPTLALRAGLISRLDYARGARQHLTDARIQRWTEEYVNLPGPADPTARALLTPRQETLVRLNCELSEGRTVSQRKLCDRFAQGMMLAARKRGEKPDENDPDLKPMALWAEARMVLAGAKDVLTLLYVEHDRRIGFGAHAVRDTQPQARTSTALPMLSLDEDVGDKDRGPRISKIADGSAHEPGRIVVTAEGRDAVDPAIREWLRREQPRSRPGSARRIVLQNLIPLLLKEVTLRDLSALHHRAESGLSDAMTEIKAELAKLKPLQARAEDL